MTPPARVMFVIHGLGRAGPELRLLDFAHGLPDAVEMHVCALGGDLTLLEEFEKTRAHVLVVPVRRAYTQWRGALKLAAYVRRRRIDVMNSFDLKTLLVCLAARALSRRRVKIVHHVVSLWEDLRPRQQALLRRAMDHADAVLCNGHAVRAEVIGSRPLAPRVAVIPNGVDCLRYRSTAALGRSERERYGFAPHEFVLGTVANVRPVKNYPFLLAAMRRLSEKHPHVRLLCVGGGEQLEEMKALAPRLGLSGTVRFTGSVPDVRPCLAALDALALCSRKEGCPNVILQAMAMSVPVVASAVGEIPHMVVDGESGLVFTPDDEDAFVSAISRLVEDAAYRGALARAGRQRVEERYSVERMIDEYTGLFEDLAGHEPGVGRRARCA